MNDEQKAKLYLDLYKIQLERFDKRRDIEWKTSIGLWSAIFVFTGFMAGKLQMQPSDLWMFGLIWILFSLVWTPWNWYANETDKGFAYVYRNRAEVLIGFEKNEITFSSPPKTGFIRDVSRVSQILITAVLLVMSWHYLSTIPVDKQTKTPSNSTNHDAAFFIKDSCGRCMPPAEKIK
jgi:hypothetical protein